MAFEQLMAEAAVKKGKDDKKDEKKDDKKDTKNSKEDSPKKNDPTSKHHGFHSHSKASGSAL